VINQIITRYRIFKKSKYSKRSNITYKFNNDNNLNIKENIVSLARHNVHDARLLPHINFALAATCVPCHM
jgi:hypothetical protein